jgi:hypothetical protein
MVQGLNEDRLSFLRRAVNEVFRVRKQSAHPKDQQRQSLLLTHPEVQPNSQFVQMMNPFY